jgi:hydroxyacylglutathione hydrolase
VAEAEVRLLGTNVGRRRLIPLHILPYTVGPIGTNGFLVWSGQRSEALVIDPGDEPDRILAGLESAALRCAAVLLTHGHFDHVGAVTRIARGSASQVYISALEASCLSDPAASTPPGVPVPEPIDPDVLLDGGEVLELAGLRVRCLPVPGHSPGSLAFVVAEPDDPGDAVCFSGDVVFAGSVGRTDIPGGSWPVLASSLARLLGEVGLEMPLLPGHGAATTFRRELGSNPFLDHLRGAAAPA